LMSVTALPFIMYSLCIHPPVHCAMQGSSFCYTMMLPALA
jgi:hypothetical protein